MGSSASLSPADAERAMKAMREQAEQLDKQQGGRGRSAAGEPPPGRGAVIEHHTDERPRRAPYVPRSQRK